MDLCPHSATVIDQSSGTEICTDCAKVMADNMSYSDVHGAVTMLDIQHGRLIRNELTDAVHLIHCDSGAGYLVDQVINILVATNKINNFRIGFRGDMGVLAFLLWNEMNKFGHPRPPHHAASALGTTTAYMQMAEREMGISPTYCPPSEYVSRICAELGLAQYFPICKIIKKAVVVMDNVLFKPEKVIAGVIMQLRKEIESGLYTRIDAKNESKLEKRHMTQNQQLHACSRFLMRPTFPDSVSNALHIPQKSMENMRIHLFEESKSIIKNDLCKISKNISI